MVDSVTCRIVLETPPAGVDYGLQKGKGSAFESVQTQRSDGRDLQFEFSADVRGTETSADFGGPFVQGPRGTRFVYIDIGTCAGQAGSCWSRRLKIPLTGITRQMIERVAGVPGAALEARVAGTGRDGTPACASVKEFGGWYPAARRASRIADS